MTRQVLLPSMLSWENPTSTVKGELLPASLMRYH
jgi:hypothetical protein